jgi:hypothetical protein
LENDLKYEVLLKTQLITRMEGEKDDLQLVDPNQLLLGVKQPLVLKLELQLKQVVSIEYAYEDNS